MNKRCRICDSTEEHDTLAEAGINDPIKFFTTTTFSNGSEEVLCNRCYQEYQDTLNELNESDTEEEESLEDYLSRFDYETIH